MQRVLVRPCHRLPQQRPVFRARQRAKSGDGRSEPKASPKAAIGTQRWLAPMTKGVGGAVAAYGRAQRSRPYTTQMVGAVAIYLCADLSAQWIHGGDYDGARTLRALAVGFGAAIPHYKWFVFLSQHFNYSRRLVSLGAKVAMNQLCFTPAFNIYFFSSQALLAGESLSTAAQRVCDTLPTTWANSFKVWPAVIAFSFAFLPQEYRPIFSGFAAVGWQTYLSFLNKKAELREKREAVLDAGNVL